LATVTVFVDDAVQGHVPQVCVRTGEPADGLHRIHTAIGGSSGWLWLLVFFGPVGWLVLLVALAFAGSARDLLVRLPYSYDAIRLERSQLRAAVGAGVALVVGFVGILIVLAGPTPRSHVRETILAVLVTATVAAMLATFALGLRYSLRRPAIELDASGRWVTLRRVDTEFAAAVEASARVRTTSHGG
jgi:hypothetical protein